MSSNNRDLVSFSNFYHISYFSELNICSSDIKLIDIEFPPSYPVINAKIVNSKVSLNLLVCFRV